MVKHYFLARLGGADGRLLADEEMASQTGERTKFAAMGGVLLTTAGVATVSMFFALHHGVGVSVGWSVPLALAWGVVIINLDRLLIVTMGSARGHPIRLASTMLARLVLAALIAIVVATPLVLQIFAKDIGAELPIVQQQQSAAFAKSVDNGADGRQLAKTNSEITAEQNVINAKGTGDQAIVNSLTAQVNAANNTVSTAYAKWQCEIGGLQGSVCPPGTSGLVGNGTRAHVDQEAYEKDVTAYNTLNGQLTTAENNLSNAQQTLANLKSQRTAQQGTINALVGKDDSANKNDTGLLEQIHALFAASAADSALAVTHWIVTALFFVIEILPVTVKCLLLLGDETPYEKIVTKKGLAAVAQADVTLQAVTAVVQTRAQLMRDAATDEAKSQRDIRDARLQSDYAIAKEKEQARERVEIDMINRDRGTRVEANKRFAAAARIHILAAVDDWAFKVREKINQGTKQPGANGQPPATTVQKTSGYNLPGGIP